MSLFAEAAADLAAAVLYEFGEVCTHRRGLTDTAITAAPSDPLPEDTFPGQYTVRLIRPDDLPAGILDGDQMVIGSVVYDVFAVKQRENGALARVYLSKA